MKYAVLALILMQITLIALGIYLIVEDDIIVGLFTVIVNTFCIPFNIKSLKDCYKYE